MILPVQRTELVETMTFTSTVYCCDLDEPPIHVDDGGANVLAVIESDLAGVDLSAFEEEEIDGRRYRKIVYDLQINFGSKLGVLHFGTMIGGTQLGFTTVHFDGQYAIDGNVGVEGHSAETTRTCAMQ